MIGEFNTFEFNVNILQFLVVNQNVIFSNFFCSGLCDPFISLCMQGVDLIRPFKASSKNQNRYCLTATDFFTKWVEAIPIKVWYINVFGFTQI